jgi:hypothetical protein
VGVLRECSSEQASEEALCGSPDTLWDCRDRVEGWRLRALWSPRGLLGVREEGEEI